MSDLARRRSSMVLCAIEEALGKFIREQGTIELVNEKKLNEIFDRESRNNRPYDRNSLDGAIEASYLNDLFDMAKNITEDTPFNKAIKYLHDTFISLKVYEIRNAIAHPNRVFLDHYWYKVAMLASNPAFEYLGLNNIKLALGSAENNSLEEPPEEWVSKYIFQVKNNLPQIFEHAITGLIGRQSEIDKLNNYLSNKRINTVSLVAPGGTGKTALALDLLDNIVHSPEHSRKLDAVLYVSMKNEILTATGIEKLTASETIVELKEQLIYEFSELFSIEGVASFEDLIEKTKDKKILLCLDNLETLIRDNPTKFDEFNQSLSENWKLLITSRIAIENATTLALSPLNAESSKKLIRIYLTKRGAKQIDDNIISKIVAKCENNPLAMRLTIDLLLLGKDVNEALSQVTNDIVEFSYKNLMNALSTTAIHILEVIFLNKKTNKMELCSILDKDMDDISSAILELSRTSLITKIYNEETEEYTLSESVKDLLLTSPKNIAIRGQIQDNLKRQAVLSQEIDKLQAEVPHWHIDYIPSETQDDLKILLSKTVKTLSKYRKSKDVDELTNTYKELKEKIYLFENNQNFLRIYARVLEELNDYPTAEKYYQQSLKGEEGDIISLSCLSKMYFSLEDYEKSAKFNKLIIDLNILKNNKSIAKFSRSVYQGYFLSLLRNNQYQQVLNETKEWKNSDFPALFGVFRSSAWKRKLENLTHYDVDEVNQAINSSLKILNTVFNDYGYSPEACKQAKKIYEEVIYKFTRSERSSEYKKKYLPFLKMVEEHILEVDRVEPVLDNLLEKFIQMDMPDNPFYEKQWRKSIEYFSEREDSIVIQIRIKHKYSESVYFAEDPSGNDYYLKFNSLKNGNFKQWSALKIGDRLKTYKHEIMNFGKDKALQPKSFYILV